MIGTFRSPGNTKRLQRLGVEPIALDLLDHHAVRKAVLEPSLTRSFMRRRLWRMFASPGTSTVASRRPTGSEPREPTRC